MGIILHQQFAKYEDRIVMYRDCFNCDICDDVVIYIGLEKNHSLFCQKCQDEIVKGTCMSTKFRKMYMKYLQVKKND